MWKRKLHLKNKRTGSTEEDVAGCQPRRVKNMEKREDNKEKVQILLSSVSAAAAAQHIERRKGSHYVCKS